MSALSYLIIAFIIVVAILFFRGVMSTTQVGGGKGISLWLFLIILIPWIMYEFTQD